MKTLKEIDYDSLNDARHLNACITETLRLNPPVGVDARVCVKDDQLPSGVKVKAGTVAFAPIYAIGRNPKYFENPDSFQPERWLGDDGSVDFPSEYKMPIFWGGPRICLGKDAAR